MWPASSMTPGWCRLEDAPAAGPRGPAAAGCHSFVTQAGTVSRSGSAASGWATGWATGCCASPSSLAAFDVDRRQEAVEPAGAATRPGDRAGSWPPGPGPSGPASRRGRRRPPGRSRTSWSVTSTSRMKEAKTLIMISAALVMTRAVDADTLDHGPLRVEVLAVLLAHPAHQEHLVVHREAEQDREHEHRCQRHDRHRLVHADQAPAPSPTGRRRRRRRTPPRRRVR